MKLYLVRHGETDWNKEVRLQGQTDIPLNDVGKLLAEKTAEGLKNIAFDSVYTSPLIRATQTAEIIIGERDIPIAKDSRIQEIGFGIFEGLCCAAEGWNIPDSDFIDFFKAPDKYRAPKEGEDFDMVMKRVTQFLEELFADKTQQDKTILISAHGASLKAMLNYIKEIPIQKFWEGGLHKNCAVTIIDYMDKKAHIVQEGITYYNEKDFENEKLKQAEWEVTNHDKR